MAGYSAWQPFLTNLCTQQPFLNYFMHPVALFDTPFRIFSSQSTSISHRKKIAKFVQRLQEKKYQNSSICHRAKKKITNSFNLAWEKHREFCKSVAKCNRKIHQTVMKNNAKFDNWSHGKKNHKIYQSIAEEKL